MRSGSLRGSIYRVLLVWGRFCVSETIIPEAQEHFLTSSARRNTYLDGGLGLRNVGTRLRSTIENAITSRNLSSFG